MSLLDKARSRTHLMLLSKGKKPKSVLVPKIPDDWDFFLGTKDRWINVKFPVEENSTNAIYIGQKDSIFPPHLHKFSDEMITVLNSGGKVKVITEDETLHLTYGQSYVFKSGEVHAVVFEEESKIFIHWHPHFENGWDAEFIEDAEH